MLSQLLVFLVLVDPDKDRGSAVRHASSVARHSKTNHQQGMGLKCNWISNQDAS